MSQMQRMREGLSNWAEGLQVVGLKKFIRFFSSKLLALETIKALIFSVLGFKSGGS